MTDKKRPTLTREDLDQLRDELMLADSLTRIENTVMILSGKGGVGKSTLAVNLAAGLAAADRDVGLLDIDIHGPSVPALLKLTDSAPPARSEKGFEAIRYSDRLKVMSIELISGDRLTDAVIWRGPMKHRMVRQFLAEVDWGSLDFLVVDAPPGTGDEPLSICQMAPPNAKAVIVTTPQELAIRDVRRSINFCKSLDMPILGIVENMSGFVCPDCGARHDLFKRGGGQRLAAETGFRFLGSIPFDPRLVTASDDGKPFVLQYPASPTARAFDEIAAPILELAPLRTKRR